jgi:DNA-binding ferritin-like protein
MVKNGRNSRHTRKNHRGSSAITGCKIVKTMLELLNQVKMYHWNTHDYSVHKSTDELYKNLDENIDKFVEVFLGKHKTRISSECTITIQNMEGNRTKFGKKIKEFVYFLTNMEQILDHKNDTDLLSIRDEILANVNQFEYLITLG